MFGMYIGVPFLVWKLPICVEDEHFLHCRSSKPLVFIFELEVISNTSASCQEALDLKDAAKNSKHRREVNELRSKEKETEGQYRILSCC